MKLKQLFTDDEAVSPVIGVILMVAITVILAAVIGTFVLGLGNQVSSTTPSANFAVNFDNNVTAANSSTVLYDNVTFTHDGGDKIKAAQLTLSSDTAFTFAKKPNGGGEGTYNTSKSFGGMGYAGKSITAGTSVRAIALLDQDTGTAGAKARAGEGLDAATFRVVWTSESGDNSATLRKWSGPDA